MYQQHFALNVGCQVLSSYIYIHINNIHVADQLLQPAILDIEMKRKASAESRGFSF